MLTFEETRDILIELRKRAKTGLHGFFSDNTEKKIAVIRSIYTTADIVFSDDFSKHDKEIQKFASVGFALGYILCAFENTDITKLDKESLFHIGKFLNILLDYISSRIENVEEVANDGEIYRH